jgi:hypothetical protein
LEPLILSDIEESHNIRRFAPLGGLMEASFLLNLKTGELQISGLALVSASSEKASVDGKAGRGQ